MRRMVNNLSAMNGNSIEVHRSLNMLFFSRYQHPQSCAIRINSTNFIEDSAIVSADGDISSHYSEKENFIVHVMKVF